MTYEKPKIRNFQHSVSDDYDPLPTIKIYPSGSCGTGDATIRDKHGWAIGGGEMHYLMDTHQNRYKLLITPAVWEDLKIQFRGTFCRQKPANLFLHIRLHDFPDEALTYFEEQMFAEYWDEEEYEVIPAKFSKHQYHKLKDREYIFRIPTKSKFRAISDCVNYLSRFYEGKSIQAWDRVDKTPYAIGNFIFIFDSDWVCDRVISPTYNNDSRHRASNLYWGFKYAWYYGRYGVFEDWCHTETPHNDYHVLPKDKW